MGELLRKRVELWGLLLAAGAVIFAATLFGFAGRLWWVFDLFSHFRLQYLLSISLVLLLLLLGDLNMSPWSYYFGRLSSVTGLVDSSRGRGIDPTWPTNRFWLRIPIDFCLVSEGIAIKSRMVGREIGSDHFPLVVDFTLNE